MPGINADGTFSLPPRMERVVLDGHPAFVWAYRLAKLVREETQTQPAEYEFAVVPIEVNGRYLISCPDLTLTWN